MVNSVVLIFRKSFTLGLAILICISVFRFVLGRYLDFWLAITQSGIGFIIKILFLMGVGFYLSLCIYVLSFAHNSAEYDENAIIVLGCGLEEDGTPAPTLKNRLDGCLKYFDKNPDCYVVVTGGYSRFNNITEASAMKKYLTEKGVPADRILTDEGATNTKENFQNSVKLLKEKGIPTDNICYVTNSFHIYRRGVYADMCGFEKITAISVKTDAAVFIPAVLREVCGVLRMKVFGY